MSIDWTRLLVAFVALAGGGGVAALGFGPVRSAVTLGQPLSLAVPVNLAEGESLGAECVGAEVTAGDIRLPPSAVRVRVTQGRDAAESVLRITTTTVIDEPVLTVLVSAGCPPRLTRTLVLLADPPLVAAVTTVTEPTGPRLAAAAPAQAPAAAALPPAPATTTTAVPAPPRARRPAPTPRVARAAPPRAAQAAPATTPAPAAAPARVAAAVRPAAAEPTSRLRLEAGQISANQAAVLAAQEQASAARATASAAEAAASAAAERMHAMEGEVTRLRADAKAQTDALLQLRQQLALDRAERDKFSPLMAVLVAALAALAAMAAWLGWRLRQRAEAPVNPDWWDRGPASIASPEERVSQAAEFAASRAPAPPQPPPRVPSAPAPWSDQPAAVPGSVDSLIAPPTVPAPTQVTIPALTRREEEASRAVSVDEQIDLEQQADFFIALGHDDAAIDLLMAHLRSTGGGIPLPYLKLLEIHRRRGQREAYERTRVRFNQRFNSVAPDWDTDPKSGRSLEDYPLVIGRIQRAWPAPLDVMAELEALLFRRGADAELFDLPAYQELLFLYLMARDLHQESGDAGEQDVDVLLPIGGRSAPIAAAEGTIVLRPEFTHGEALSLDLDLSGGHAPSLPAEGAAAPAAPPPNLDLSPLASEDDFSGDNPDARPKR